MRIDNKTHWRTDHLRAFLTRIAKDELEGSQRSRLVVVVKYNRQKDRGSCSGYAIIGGSYARIMVPSQIVDHTDLAHTIAHEFAHVRGLRHRAMNCERYSRTENWRERYAWADGLPLERKPIVPHTKLDTSWKIANAESYLKVWQTKAKRAQTFIKKYQRQVRYYTTKLAAKTATHERGTHMKRVMVELKETPYVGVCPACSELVKWDDKDGPVWTCPADLSPSNPYWEPNDAITEAMQEEAGVYSKCGEDFGLGCYELMPLHGKCYDKGNY